MAVVVNVMPGAQAALYMPRKEGNEWELHVNIVQRDANRGGSNHSYSCIYCEHKFQGSSSRIKDHLTDKKCKTHCKSIPANVAPKLKKWLEDNQSGGKRGPDMPAAGDMARMFKCAEHKQEELDLRAGIFIAESGLSYQGLKHGCPP